METNELKQHLFTAYGGFADKRIKNLNKADTFIVDDRSQSDRNARGGLFGWFCAVLVKVLREDTVEIILQGNVPESKDVIEWARRNELEHRRHDWLSLRLSLGEEVLLEELATHIEAIVKPGARYLVPSYKYVCPRTAATLRRLAQVLRSFREKSG